MNYPTKLDKSDYGFQLSAKIPVPFELFKIAKTDSNKKELIKGKNSSNSHKTK